MPVKQASCSLLGHVWRLQGSSTQRAVSLSTCRMTALSPCCHSSSACVSHTHCTPLEGWVVSPHRTILTLLPREEPREHHCSPGCGHPSSSLIAPKHFQLLKGTNLLLTTLSYQWAAVPAPHLASWALYWKNKRVFMVDLKISKPRRFPQVEGSKFQEVRQWEALHLWPLGQTLAVNS